MWSLGWEPADSWVRVPGFVPKWGSWWVRAHRVIAAGHPLEFIDRAQWLGMLGQPVLSPNWDPVGWGLLSHQHLSVGLTWEGGEGFTKTVNNKNKSVLQRDFRPPS